MKQRLTTDDKHTSRHQLLHSKRLISLQHQFFSTTVMGKQKPKPTDNSRHTPARERGRSDIIHNISRKLDVIRNHLKNRKLKEPWDIFDSSHHQKQNANGTWTRHKPKKYWQWRHQVTPYRAALDPTKPPGGHFSTQLIQPIIKCIIDVQTTQQEQHTGNPKPGSGTTARGQGSETAQRPLGWRARKRINLIKRHKDAFTAPRPSDADLRKNTGRRNSTATTGSTSKYDACTGKHCT